MRLVEPGLTVKSLAEVAWLVSRAGRATIESGTEPSATSLRQFWQSARQLQRDWDQSLGAESGLPLDSTQFEATAAQLFATELLVRVWATVLATIDVRTGKNDLTRIAGNTVSGLLQLRHQVLGRLVDQPESPSWAAALDRLRRRCDRWTDLLIGNLVGNDDVFQFAFDPDRARDFAEEARMGDSIHPVELLISAGVHLSFLGHLPDITLDSSAYQELIRSILQSIPADAFNDDGSLHSPLLPQLEKCGEFDDASCPDEVLLPGISLESLRRRFP